MLSPLPVLITRGWETKLKLGVAGEQWARCMLLALLVGVTFLAVLLSLSTPPPPKKKIKGNIISSFRNTHRKWVSTCWLLASNRALTGGEWGCSPPRFIWTFPPEDSIQGGGTEGCLCTEGVRGNGSWRVISRRWFRSPDEVRRHVAAISEVSAHFSEARLPSKN